MHFLRLICQSWRAESETEKLRCLRQSLSYCAADLGICALATWLLQLCSGKTATIYHRPTSASAQHHCMTCRWCKTDQPCDTDWNSYTDCLSNTVSATNCLHAQTLDTRQQSMTLSCQQCHYSHTNQCTARSSIFKYSHACQTSQQNKVWRAWFLDCQTGRLEQPAITSSLYSQQCWLDFVIDS